MIPCEVCGRLFDDVGELNGWDECEDCEKYGRPEIVDDEYIYDKGGDPDEDPHGYRSDPLDIDDDY